MTGVCPNGCGESAWICQNKCRRKEVNMAKKKHTEPKRKARFMMWRKSIADLESTKYPGLNNQPAIDTLENKIAEAAHLVKLGTHREIVILEIKKVISVSNPIVVTDY